MPSVVLLDSTTLIAPDQTTRVDPVGNLLITFQDNLIIVSQGEDPEPSSDSKPSCRTGFRITPIRFRETKSAPRS